MCLHHEGSKCSLYVCSGVQGSQIFKMEFNYLDLFKSYCIFSDFVVPVVPMLSPRCPHIVPTLCPCCPHHSHVIPIVFIIITSSIWSPHYPHPHIPTPPTPTLPRGGTPRISKNSIRFELIEIFKFCLKI